MNCLARTRTGGPDRKPVGPLIHCDAKASVRQWMSGPVGFFVGHLHDAGGVMAGEWIKIENVTPHKPEIFSIGIETGLTPDDVLGKLIRLWIWADEQTIAGNVTSVTEKSIDYVVRHENFGKAMVKSGWLLCEEGVTRLPHFKRHNGQTAKGRALAAKRAAKFRTKHRYESNAESNAASVTPALRERYLEKKNFSSSSDAPGKTSSQEESGFPFGGSKDFERAWEEWLAYRKERKLSNWRPKTLKAKFAEMESWGEAAAIESIRQSIANGWQGLFEPKAGPKSKPANILAGLQEFVKEAQDRDRT